MNESAPLVTIEALNVAVNGKTLYDNFSLKIRRGEKILIRGPSGCGKSTLLKLILGFAQPDSGLIEITGIPLTHKTVWALRQQLAYVPQEPDLNNMKAGDVIEECFQYKANHSIKQNRDRVAEILEAFGLPLSILKQQTRELSGGEKQRLVMTAAVLLDRPVILLDEASSALDPDSCKRVIDYFRSRQELCMLAVSHDREWEGLADAVVTLGNGGQVK